MEEEGERKAEEEEKGRKREGGRAGTCLLPAARPRPPAREL